MNRAGLGLAVGAGYLLGRTKKLKLAFAVGTLVAGKRMHLNPKMLAELASQQLQNNPQFKEIGDQLREDLRGVGKAASGAMVERQLDAFADRLHGRTAQVRDQLSGVVPDLGPDDSEEYEEEDDDAEGYDDGDADEHDADAEADEHDADAEADEHDADEEDEPEQRAPSQKAPPAKKAAAKKTAPAKKAAKTAAPAKKASASKTASAGKKTARKTVTKKATPARSTRSKGGEGR
ncbi:DNA primase [Streptomyces sp. YS415]|uniref:DNA primase n=1 Tax=Streptomyces sp. YS415 TaxID=2944806 RepID=UPI002020030F|nr:DNA primase [Streptomyces sp. YS415]MCL7428320.1 DNA primase [Streptomyces sp. YS415]